MAELFCPPGQAWTDLLQDVPAPSWNDATETYELSDNQGLLYFGQVSVGDTLTFNVTWTDTSNPTGIVAVYDKNYNEIAVVNYTPDGPGVVTYTATTDFPAQDNQLGHFNFEIVVENMAVGSVILTPAVQPTKILPVTSCIEISYSKDGGNTWSPWRNANMGWEGNFRARALFRRLGIGRRILLRTLFSADRGRDIVQAAVDTSPFP